MKDHQDGAYPEEDPLWHHPGEDFPGQRFLKGASPREVLALLNREDPLAIERRCTVALGEHGYLVCLDTAIARALALTAYHSLDYTGSPRLTEWLEGIVDEALIQLLERQHAEELASVPVEDSNDFAFYDGLSRATSLPLEGTRRACMAINALDADTRLAFWHVVLLKKPIADHARRNGLPREVVQQRVRRALKEISQALRPERDSFELPGEGEDPS